LFFQTANSIDEIGQWYLEIREEELNNEEAIALEEKRFEHVINQLIKVCLCSLLIFILQ
jgi:hypothetical protein